jgi:SanA protein
MLRRSWYKWLLAFSVLSFVLVFLVDLWVSRSTQNQLYSNTETIPKNKVGLLLGTAKSVVDGRVNLYYQYRINAAVELYKSGKIEYVLISGDNSREEYSEPEDMRADLIAAGIPANKIFLDYAGFRTYDSIVRCGEVFGERKITVISQAFHNQRALFIAQNKGITAIAYNAQDVPAAYDTKTQIREKLARVKMMIDLMFNISPKFYGPKVEIK